MLGVFKRRWKPKSTAKANNNLHSKNNQLVTNYNLYSEPVLSIDSQFDKIVSPSTRQIHSLCDEKVQLSVAYETIKSLPPSHSPPTPLTTVLPTNPTPLLNPYAVSNIPSATYLSESECPAPSVSRTPNICVEEGRIEFVKDDTDGAMRHLINCNNNNNRLRDSRRHSREEKIDNAKECLESRIAELEKELESERKLVQREKLNVARLQRQLSRKELIQRDADRERRLRSDSEARLRRSESDTERCRAKLAVLQREFVRMEDTVRSMLQYKSKYEQLKQDKASLTVACENHIQHFQSIICKIKEENDELKKQLQSFNLSQEDNSEVQSVLLDRIEVLQNQNSKLMREGEIQRKQYEKCLDDVANQVVKAIFTQKNLQDDVNRLQQRVKELENNNNSLSKLLWQRVVQRGARSSGANSQNPNSIICSGTRSGRYCPAFACLESSLCNKLNIIAEKVEQQRPVSLDERCLQKSWDRAGSSNIIWLPLQRPQSLNLETNLFLNACSLVEKVKKEAEEESPESGIRDEGYSTMSSDVQGTSELPPKALSDLKEVTDESDAAAFCNNSLDTRILRSRNSFPAVRDISPYQHIIRSFSDSQLCLRITAGSCSLAPTKSSVTAALVGKYHQSFLHHHHRHYHQHHCQRQLLPVHRAMVARLLEVPVREEDTEDGFSFCSSDLLDTEYIHQWLQPNEKRPTMQQHQQLPPVEYNAAEVEDWSMEDTENWKKIDKFVNCYRGSLDYENASKCVAKNMWDIAAYRIEDRGDAKCSSWAEDENQNSLSSESSWSSSCGANSEEGCASPFDNSSKRSSSVVSSEGNSEGVVVGTDFTRDFYRLVKFESTKSLASTSSKSHNGGKSPRCCDSLSAVDDACGGAVDREQALQNVLKFIAEQQCYCISRLVQDEQRENVEFLVEEEGRTAVKISEADSRHEVVTLQEEDDGYFSKISNENNTVFEDMATVGRSCCTDAGTSTFCDSEPLRTTSATAIDYKNLFRGTCDTCFQNLEKEPERDENICDRCAESYIECLHEEAITNECDSRAENDLRIVKFVASTPVIVPKSCLDTVLEEQEEAVGVEVTEKSVSTTKLNGNESDFVSLHDRATSKEVIEELNRMIRKGDELNELHNERTSPMIDLDENCGCATGWVHVEQDIDFNDPKARANLLDVMLASSSSSSCDSSRNNSDSETLNDEGRNYKHLHRLHRFRRQRRASASRQMIMGALRFTNFVRPSIIGRDNFYNRYGEKEREAVASFDFLEELSTTSLSTVSEPSDNPSCGTTASVGAHHICVAREIGVKMRYTRQSASGDCDTCCDWCSCCSDE